MFVGQEYRGATFDTTHKLLTGLLNWAGAQQFRDIFLGTTPKFLAVHRFYEKNGFIEIQKQDLPGTFPVMTVDTKFYRYELIGH